MLDEPFAHPSIDRIDDVGRFLKATRSQFILTAPTTLDRAQLDPALTARAVGAIRADLAARPTASLAATLRALLAHACWVEQEAFLGSSMSYR